MASFSLCVQTGETNNWEEKVQSQVLISWHLKVQPRRGFDGTTLCDNAWWHLQIEISGPQMLTLHLPVLPHCILQSASQLEISLKNIAYAHGAGAPQKSRLDMFVLLLEDENSNKQQWLWLHEGRDGLESKPWIHVNFGQVSIGIHSILR